LFVIFASYKIKIVVALKKVIINNYCKECLKSLKVLHILLKKKLNTNIIKKINIKIIYMKIFFFL